MKRAILKICITDPELHELYRKHVDVHNTKIRSSNTPDSGFDLFIREKTIFHGYQSKLVDLCIKGEMTYDGFPCGYYVYPRSSIQKTPLMLANGAGIIDSGYRDSLKAAFRSFEENYVVEPHTRLLQICHGTLCPIEVVLLPFGDELSETERGTGGFGSTGIVGIMS
jgi:dUTP pyrophosphatase